MMTIRGDGVIVGVGTQLVRVDSLRDELAGAAAGWLERTWTPAERETCLARPDPAPGLAARKAAKAATLAALGAPDGVGSLDIEVVREPSGKPRLALHGPAEAAARGLGASRWHVSLTHLETHALAVVLLESGTP